MKVKKDNFIRYCIEYNEAIVNGNSKIANKSQDKINKLYLDMERQARIQMLRELISNDNSCVKVQVATYLLKENEELDLAIKTLKDISKEDTIIGLCAYAMIYSWKRNEITFFETD